MEKIKRYCNSIFYSFIKYILTAQKSFWLPVLWPSSLICQPILTGTQETQAETLENLDGFFQVFFFFPSLKIYSTFLFETHMVTGECSQSPHTTSNPGLREIAMHCNHGTRDGRSVWQAEHMLLKTQFTHRLHLISSSLHHHHLWSVLWREHSYFGLLQELGPGQLSMFEKPLNCTRELKQCYFNIKMLRCRGMIKRHV